MMKNKSIYILGIMIFLYLVVDFLSNKYLLNNEIITKALSEQMDISRLGTQKFSQSWTLSLKKVGFICFYVITKVVVSFFVILIGFLTANTKVKSADLLFKVIIAESTFVLQILMEIVHFNVFEKNFDIKEVLHHSPFSVLRFFDISALPVWAIYPLENIGIFEVMYVMLISFLVIKITQKSFAQNFKIIGSSYLTGLSLWFCIHILFKIL